LAAAPAPWVAAEGIWRVLKRLSTYIDNPDALTRASNLIAMIVVGNQPFYPLYVWLLVGANFWPTAVTFLSTPFFAMVPLLSRRNTTASRALLPAVGFANSFVCMWAFGESSGVGWFLAPCALIAALSFRKNEWRAAAALIVVPLVAFAVLHGDLPPPLVAYTPEENQSLTRLHLISVACLTLFAGYALIRARMERAPV
jgi:hypothetical protein